MQCTIQYETLVPGIDEAKKMSGFGHYDQTVAELENAIAIRCVVIGLDWTDNTQMYALASEALQCTTEQHLAMLHAPDAQTRARGNLFALAVLMFDTLRQSAQSGLFVEGSGICKALNRAFDEVYSDSARSGA
jgi:hypothetical protein